jgi:two-component system sensor kinase FixL
MTQWRHDQVDGAPKGDALFRALIATAVDGIIVIDSKGLVAVYNGACENLFGYSSQEVIGQNVMMLMPQPYHGEHDRYLSNYTNTGNKKIIGIGREVVGRRKDQSTFPMYLSVGEGELDGQRIFVGIIHDLTERKKADDAIREREARLQSILDTVPDAIVIIDEMGTVESFSPAASRLFGYEATQVIGRNVKMLMPQPYRSQHDTYLDNYRHTGERRVIGIGRVVVGQRSDGSTFPMELAVGVVEGQKRKLFTGFVRDITERQGTESRLQELQAELLHVSRLNAMGQMSSAIAHELNQPLAAIMNYVNAVGWLLKSPDADAMTRAQEINEKVANQVQRAGAIIHNLRQFVEKRESKKSPENLNKVVEEAIALSFVGISHINVKVRLDLNPVLPPIWMDKIQIQQVLINLIRNSIEAMQGVDKRELGVHSSQGEPGFVEIAVSDSGPGLSPEVRSRLFQAFSTTKNDGMGIGLTICQSIVTAHGGSIWHDEQAPSGTTFRFRLPLSDQAIPAG